jgi:hypothetical protein
MSGKTCLFLGLGATVCVLVVALVWVVPETMVDISAGMALWGLWMWPPWRRKGGVR